MKFKNLFILPFIVMLSSYVIAQDYYSMNIGASLADQVSIRGGFKTGLYGGIGYEHQFSDKYWIVTGIDYIQKGTNIGVVQNVTEFSTRLTYIEVPLYAKYYYKWNENFAWSVYAGPSLGYVLSATSRFFQVAQPRIVDIPVGGDGVSQLDLGLNGGGELNFRTGYGYLAFFGQAQISAFRVLEDQAGNALRNLTFTAGIKLKFGEELADNDEY